MRFSPHEKVALLVDGPNLWGAAKGLGFDIDYAKLYGLFNDQATLTSACYFTRMDETDDFNPLRPLVDWLDFNGWQVFTRTKDTDVDLAVTAMELAKGVDHIIIASGDSDFISLVEALQRIPKRVTILSTIKTSPPHCAEDLRRGAFQFLDLENLRRSIARADRLKETA